MSGQLSSFIKLTLLSITIGLNIVGCYQPRVDSDSDSLQSESSQADVEAVSSGEQEKEPPTTDDDNQIKTSEQIYEFANPSVVLIRTRQGLGSGFIVQEDGLILTNAHVLENARFPVTIVTADGDELIADLISFHQQGADLAAIKIRDIDDLPTLDFGSESSVKVGQTVYAIGSPLGNRNTFTNGIVSRIIPDDDLIQHNAAINPGNSGGPLLNNRGEVIGINTFIESVKGGSDGLGFAITADIFRPFLAEVEQLEARNDSPSRQSNKRSQRQPRSPEQLIPELSQQESLFASFQEGDAILPNGSYFHPYTIQAERGQFLKVEMLSDDFDPVLILIHKDREELIGQSDNVSRRNWNARVETMLPEDGEYVILALTYDAEAIGDYQLNVLLDR